MRLMRTVLSQGKASTGGRAPLTIEDVRLRLGGGYRAAGRHAAECAPFLRASAAHAQHVGIGSARAAESALTGMAPYPLLEGNSFLRSRMYAWTAPVGHATDSTWKHHSDY